MLIASGVPQQRPYLVASLKRNILNSKYEHFATPRVSKSLHTYDLAIEQNLN